MSVEAPTPEGQNPQGEPDDLGSLEAAEAAFAAQQPQEEAQTEADPDPEAESEADTEAEQADPEAEEPTDELVEVEIEGKTYKVPPELQKGYLRQSDYSRAMNAVSEKEKTYTSRLELIDGAEKAAEERAEALAAVHLLDARSKALEEALAQAKKEDPQQAALIALELIDVRDQRREANNAAAQVARKLTDTKNKLFQERVTDMAKVLDKDLPGWRDQVGSEITKYAESIGYSRDEIGAITDPKVVIALDKARRFDALQKSKEQLKAKAKDAPPVVKPGAARPRVDAGQDAMARLRKSNSLDDAAALFEARMK